ncbi:MAG: hypothetical protein JW785_06115 [Acidimicrobiia bacterium]|nr:hypothetical protein [Acidimicrobiia bacterium]
MPELPPWKPLSRIALFVLLALILAPVGALLGGNIGQRHGATEVEQAALLSTAVAAVLAWWIPRHAAPHRFWRPVVVVLLVVLAAAAVLCFFLWTFSLRGDV